MSIEGNYDKCSERQSVVYHQKVNIASEVRGGQCYVTRR